VSVGSRAIVVALTLTALTPPFVAEAHLGHEVQTAERYLKVDAADDHVRVVVSLMLGPVEAARVLRIADRDAGDGDGNLTEAEADAYMAIWGEGLLADLPIEVDGEPVAASWGEPYLDPLGPISPRPATVEMVARIPLDAGTHSITLRDRMQRDTYDRTDVAFRARDSAELVASGPEESPSERVPTLAFAGSRGPDVFTAVVNAPGPVDLVPDNDEGAQPWLWLGASLVVLFAVALAFVAIRRRAR
jgi:hypothetical protein